MTKLVQFTSARQTPAAPTNFVKTAFAPLDEAKPIADELSALALRRYKGENVDLSVMIAKAGELRPLVFGDTDAKKTRALLGMMLDAIPAAKSVDSGPYIDAAVNTILAEPVSEIDKYGITREHGGFTHVVVASAVRRIWRTATFCPSISELLEALRSERSKMQATIGLIDTIAAGKERARIADERREEMRRKEREAYRDADDDGGEHG